MLRSRDGKHIFLSGALHGIEFSKLERVKSSDYLLLSEVVWSGISDCPEIFNGAGKWGSVLKDKERATSRIKRRKKNEEHNRLRQERYRRSQIPVNCELDVARWRIAGLCCAIIKMYTRFDGNLCFGNKSSPSC